MSGKIIILDDDPAFGRLQKLWLSGAGFTAEMIENPSPEGLKKALESGEIDAVLTDLHMPQMDGLAVIRYVREKFSKVPVILMTGQGTTDATITAMKEGAFNYLTKPFEKSELVEMVTEAIKCHRLTSDKASPATDKESRETIIGTSKAMTEAYKEVGRVAAQPVTVLIRGETGTGKELFARAIYQHSGRSDKPFLAVNCAAIPETLLESTLFGHEKGSFTGAHQRRVGCFEQCQHGTIFLDEIGEMSPGTQAKLLRVLQDKTMQRIGGSETIRVDARVITATNCNLEKMVKEKKFREDLYHRLDVVTIRLPPLRERAEDIPALVRHLLEKCGEELSASNPKIQKEAMELLCEQPWPGNVRQLENTLRRSILLAGGFTITAEHVQKALRSEDPAEISKEAGWPQLIADLLKRARLGEIAEIHPVLFETVEKELYRQAIKAANGNQAKASRWIGVSRVTMHQKLKDFGLLAADIEDEPVGEAP